MFPPQASAQEGLSVDRTPKQGKERENKPTVRKEVLESNCYLGFFVSGSMVLSRIDEILHDSPNIVALKPRHIFAASQE